MDIQRILERSKTIRIISYDAIYRDQVIALAKQMHSESIYADMSMNEDLLIAQLEGCGNIIPDRYFRIAVCKDEVLGGFYGHYHGTFFSTDIIANDLVWFVAKEKRGSVAAVALLSDFESWAKSKGAKKVMIGQSTARNIEQTKKMYEHCGYRVIGYNTVKELIQ